jgi:Tfp pilus assembly protein PilO
MAKSNEQLKKEKKEQEEKTRSLVKQLPLDLRMILVETKIKGILRSIEHNTIMTMSKDSMSDKDKTKAIFEQWYDFCGKVILFLKDTLEIK